LGQSAKNGERKKGRREEAFSRRASLYYFQNCTRGEKYLKTNKHNSLQLARDYAWIFVHAHYLFLKARLLENSLFFSSLLRTDNARG